MLAAVQGYYDGNQIIINEDDRRNLTVGDELIITILGRNSESKTATRTKKRRQLIDSDAFVVSTERTIN